MARAHVPCPDVRVSSSAGPAAQRPLPRPASQGLPVQPARLPRARRREQRCPHPHPHPHAKRRRRLQVPRRAKHNAWRGGAARALRLRAHVARIRRFDSGQVCIPLEQLDNTHAVHANKHASRVHLPRDPPASTPRCGHARSPGGTVAGRSGRWLLDSTDSRRMSSIRIWTRRSISSCEAQARLQGQRTLRGRGARRKGQQQGGARLSGQLTSVDLEKRVRSWAPSQPPATAPPMITTTWRIEGPFPPAMAARRAGPVLVSAASMRALYASKQTPGGHAGARA